MSLIPFFSGALNAYNNRSRLEREARYDKELLDQQNSATRSNSLFDAIITGKLDPSKPGMDAILEKYDLEELQALSGQMKAEKDTFGFGPNVRFRKPPEWDKNIKGDNLNLASSTWLQYFTNNLVTENQRQNFMSQLNANPNAKELFINEANRYSDMFIDGQLKGRTQDSLNGYKYKAPNAAFPTLFQFLDELQDTTSNRKAVKQTVNAKIKERAEQKGEIQDANTAVAFNFTTMQGEEITTLHQFSDIQLKSVFRIVGTLGYEPTMDGVEEYLDNYQHKIPGETPQEAYHVLFGAVDFELAGASTLNSVLPEKSVSIAVHNTADRLYYQNNNYNGAVNALAPLMVLAEETKHVRDKRAGYNYGLAPPESYFDRNNIDRQQVIDQYDATEETLKKLAELEGLLKDPNTSTGLLAIVRKLGFNVFGEGGQLDQFFGNYALDDNYDVEEANTTKADLIKTAIDSGFLSKDAATKMTQMDALKLSLAAEMARAVDPSGRLSNQDFEVQLKRLGEAGLFTGKPIAQANLSVVIREFERRRQRLGVLATVAKDPEFTPKHAKILKADLKLRQAQNIYENAKLRGRISTQGSVRPEDSKATATGNLILNDEFGVYVDENDNFFKDQQGTQPLTNDEVDKLIEEKLGVNL